MDFFSSMEENWLTERVRESGGGGEEVVGAGEGPAAAAIMKFEGSCCKHANTSQGLTGLWMALPALAAGKEMMSGAGNTQKSLKLQPHHFHSRRRVKSQNSISVSTDAAERATPELLRERGTANTS